MSLSRRMMMMLMMAMLRLTRRSLYVDELPPWSLTTYGTSAAECSLHRFNANHIQMRPHTWTAMSHVANVNVAAAK